MFAGKQGDSGRAPKIQLMGGGNPENIKKTQIFNVICKIQRLFNEVFGKIHTPMRSCPVHLQLNSGGGSEALTF